MKRQANESTGSRPKSACTKRQTGGSTYQQSKADTGGHRPGGIAASMEEQEPYDVLRVKRAKARLADPRVLSVRSRMLQISGPARAPAPARRVLALGWQTGGCTYQQNVANTRGQRPEGTTADTSRRRHSSHIESMIAAHCYNTEQPSH